MSDITNSDSFQILFAALSRLLIELPTLIVLGIGIVLGMQNMKKHPSTSRSAVIGFSILLLSNIIFAFVGAWLPYAIYRNTGNPEAFGWANVGLGIVGTITSCAAYILLIMAIFRWRRAEEPAAAPRETPRPYDVASNPYETQPGQQS